MKTINNRIENELIIKNSKFIGILIPLQKNNYKDILEEIKKKYPKANHYCFAYIYDHEKQSSDDKEPSNTAGLPILNVLENVELNHVLAVVVRYFGGIKLGAGGLVRAYTKSITECLKKAEIYELEKGYLLRVDFNYEDEKNINYIINNSNIIEKSYQEKITYIIEVNEEIKNKLDKYNPEIIKEINIIKKNQS